MIRNFLIFLIIALAVTGGYFYFVQNSGPATSLISSGGNAPTDGGVNSTSNPIPLRVSNDDPLAQDFLSLLLSVKNIRLNDGIFSDVAFTSLQDSTIVIFPEGSEGRPNPFAQFGTDSSQISPFETLPPLPQVPSETTGLEPESMPEDLVPAAGVEEENTDTPTTPSGTTEPVSPVPPAAPAPQQ